MTFPPLAALGRLLRQARRLPPRLPRRPAAAPAKGHRPVDRPTSRPVDRPVPAGGAGPTPGTAGRTGRYPGDFQGSAIKIDYGPTPDGQPDPGEVVWAWVPFEEDPGQGKDRPVLIVGREGDLLLGLMLTSKDHDQDAARHATHGRVWFELGSGPWDRQGRPSEVRMDRVLRLSSDQVRREGSALDRARFDAVVARLRTTLADRPR